MAFDHTTVLLEETIDNLEINPNGIYVDCTLGGAGHAKYILTKLSNKGHLIAFDQDINAINNAKIKLQDEIELGKVTFIHSNFRHIVKELAALGVKYVDGIYYDLGVSSPQLDQVERGFSYHNEAHLDMRMDQTQSLTAFEVINEWDFSDLVKVIYRYGEEKFAKRIARAIEKKRKLKPIETTTELSSVIKEAIPAATRRTGGHPAKRTFQAIRIAVNDELGSIEESIDTGLELLKVGGRMSVISFHSLEDRLVKQMFKEASQTLEVPRNLPVMPDQYQAEFEMINKKPIVPSEEEINVNNRARSAKLRVIERKTIKENI